MAGHVVWHEAKCGGAVSRCWRCAHPFWHSAVNYSRIGLLILEHRTVPSQTEKLSNVKASGKRRHKEVLHVAHAPTHIVQSTKLVAHKLSLHAISSAHTQKPFTYPQIYECLLFAARSRANHFVLYHAEQGNRSVHQQVGAVFELRPR